MSTELGISALYSKARPISVNVRFVSVPDATPVGAALNTSQAWVGIFTSKVCAQKGLVSTRRGVVGAE